MKPAVRLLVGLLVVAGLVWLFRILNEPEPIPVVLTTVERGRVQSTVANTRAGTVKACRRSKVAPAVGGRVARLSVREGDRVAKDDVLLTLWNEDIAARLDLAASEQSAARARLEEVCLSAEGAEREADRLARLRERSLVSEDEVDRVTTESRVRRAACDGAAASLDVARARVAAAKAALDLTVLTAPFDGIVAEVNAEIGEYVTPSPPGISTLPAVDLIDDRCLYVTAPIDEVDAPALAPGMPACVQLDAFPEERCAARIRRIAPYVFDREKQARTVEIEVELEGEEARAGLLPGYSADVEVILERREDALRIPTEALLENDRVLVYRDGVLEERRIEPGLANWRFTEVLSGLGEGERIVISVSREGVEAGARVVPESRSGDASGGS